MDGGFALVQQKPRGEARGENLKPKFVYPTLSKSPSAILAIEEVCFEAPRPIKEHTWMDGSKYCEFHQAKGHETYSCCQLKK